MHDRNRTTAARRGMTLAIAALALGATTLAFQSGADAMAQNGADAVKTRIAVVNVDRVMSGLDEVTARINDANRRLQGKVDELEALVDRGAQIESDLETLELSREERSDLVIELLVLRRQVEAFQGGVQQVRSLEDGRTLAEIYAKVQAAVSAYAEREGYDIVLADDSTYTLPNDGAPANAIRQALRNRSVLFRSDALDITDRVIAEMNAQFNSGG